MDAGRAVSTTCNARTDPVPKWYYDVRDIRDINVESRLKSIDYMTPKDIIVPEYKCRIASVCKDEPMPRKHRGRHIPSVSCSLVGPYGTTLMSTSRVGPWDNQTRLKALDPLDI
jgi:hypothetical protein